MNLIEVTVAGPRPLRMFIRRLRPPDEMEPGAGVADYEIRVEERDRRGKGTGVWGLVGTLQNFERREGAYKLVALAFALLAESEEVVARLIASTEGN